MSYEQLAAHFDQHQTVNGFTTISGEQVVTRLNAVLGFDGWSFTIKQHGIDQESDSTWVLGHLEVYREDGRTIVREQFGSQKFNRYSQGSHQGKIIDLANDQMGAATGALKKCASLIGVGLYLRSRGGSNGQARGNQGNQSRGGAGASNNAPSSSSGQQPGSTGARTALLCDECGDPLEAVKVTYNGKKPDETWSPPQLAAAGRKKFNRVLCQDHFFNS